MFKRKKIEGFHIKISICKDVLEAIFDECDKNNIDETGGRIVGYYQQGDNKLNIKACGLIGPGPNAQVTYEFFSGRRISRDHFS